MLNSFSTLKSYLTLSFCNRSFSLSPFTPFIVVLGTAILNTNLDDLKYLGQVVDSLNAAAIRAPGAKRIADICTILYKGAQSCIKQSLENDSPSSVLEPPIPQVPTSNMTFVPTQDGRMNGGGYSGYDNTQWNSLPHDDWASLQLENTDDMMVLFDNYLAGNLPIYENELIKNDRM